MSVGHAGHAVEICRLYQRMAADGKGAQLEKIVEQADEAENHQYPDGGAQNEKSPVGINHVPEPRIHNECNEKYNFNNCQNAQLYDFGSAESFDKFLFRHGLAPPFCQPLKIFKIYFTIYYYYKVMMQKREDENSFCLNEPFGEKKKSLYLNEFK